MIPLPLLQNQKYNIYPYRMDAPRFNSASSFTPQHKVVISGGQYDRELLSSVVHTVDGQTFKELSPLPVPLSCHCMVALDDSFLFVTGGVTTAKGLRNAPVSGKTFIYDANSKLWQPKPELPTPRQGR